ncbi:MAG TPA: FAD-linked oxidase C-terminal domain-containing protein [Terriglobales bacterium]|jgi:FAD/FMN-containing dehydrogenase/Fe-S oxidoreductase|nr:FAD-linked oxidase C-terminal domain-containing protein [Terriglobales bacterium]
MSSPTFATRAQLAKSATVDASALAASLRRHLRGEVRFDKGSRALYATDGSSYRQVPIGVVVPRDLDDVIATVALAREFGAPILCRGGGTSLAGQCCNVAVVIDMSKYLDGILQVDPVRRLARVQPGVVLDHLRNAAERHHLTFGPDPATHDRCTLGGMIGNNSCGVHSIMAGKTDDNVEELEVLTYDGLRMRVGQTSTELLEQIIREGGRRGQIYAGLKALAAKYGELIRQRYPNIPRRVSGYNLNYLLAENGFHVARALVGSEGTCVTILAATCRLVESPPERVLLVIAWPDIYQCADHVPEIMAHKPIGLEGMDDLLIEYMKRKKLDLPGLAVLPEGGGWLLAEFGGSTQQEAEAQARGLMESLAGSTSPPQMRLFTDKQQVKRVWEVRESGLGATSHVPGEPLTWEGWEDAAVAPENLGKYLRDFRKLMAGYGYRGVLYGHFGHACVHTRINFDMQSREGVRTYRKFVEECADMVVGYGGSLSGEHGDGQSRAELLPRMFGRELVQAFSEFKALWDPDWKMNPGKVVEPYRLDENLRPGVDAPVVVRPTHFQFPDDKGDLALATLRCVGVGKCRRDEGGVMCPSFRATRDEEHSTRGRAHLLWEMTRGDVLRDGWRDEHVKDSLDLCLSCKGCKSDCPVGVDVATYKAEFLSHYYQGRIRPRSAYAFGNIDLWARLASHAPGLANLATQLPFLREISKLVAGMPLHRSIPAFAPQTFRDWFARRAPRPDGSPVVLWPDTFNNYLLPHTAQAAVEVLEAAGFRVLLPLAPLCCGRPLYDFGMLDRAKRLLLDTLDTLAIEIEAGMPVIVLEPSCAAVFRDELVNLFPNDARARRLSERTFLLSEFLEKEATGFQPPRLDRKALVHGHCHHKSVMKMTDEESVLKKMGVAYEAPAPGCCGMAGSFGFEHEKYDISVAVGELELLPAVREASPETLIIADGFSCREQIAQGTDRHALHLAEVMQMALREGYLGDAGPFAEQASVRLRQEDVRASMRRAGLAVAGVAAGAALLWALTRRH